MFNEGRLKNACIIAISKLKMLIQEVEIANLTDTQWYLNFEDELNKLSTKDHNADRDS